MWACSEARSSGAAPLTEGPRGGCVVGPRVPLTRAGLAWSAACTHGARGGLVAPGSQGRSRVSRGVRACALS